MELLQHCAPDSRERFILDPFAARDELRGLNNYSAAKVSVQHRQHLNAEVGKQSDRLNDFTIALTSSSRLSQSPAAT
jgi:hypothetical protein